MRSSIWKPKQMIEALTLRLRYLILLNSSHRTVSVPCFSTVISIEGYSTPPRCGAWAVRGQGRETRWFRVGSSPPAQPRRRPAFSSKTTLPACSLFPLVDLTLERCCSVSLTRSWDHTASNLSVDGFWTSFCMPISKDNAVLQHPINIIEMWDFVMCEMSMNTPSRAKLKASFSR